MALAQKQTYRPGEWIDEPNMSISDIKKKLGKKTASSTNDVRRTECLNTREWY